MLQQPCFARCASYLKGGWWLGVEWNGHVGQPPTTRVELADLGSTGSTRGFWGSWHRYWEQGRYYRPTRKMLPDFWPS